MTVKSVVVAVGTTATQLSPAGTDNIAGSSIAIKNSGASTVYVGGSDVTTVNGWPLAAGESMGVDQGTKSGSSGGAAGSRDEAVYGIVASGSVNVNVLATGV